MFRTHDLVRLTAPEAIIVDGVMPSWASAMLRRAPWVVVRRGRIERGRVPVGIRGLARGERLAAFVDETDVVTRVSPEELASRQDRRTRGVFAALAKVAPVLAGRAWGPGGSVGFELATGEPVVTMTSDLDVVLRLGERVAAPEAGDLLERLRMRAAPVRVDVMVETPCGGVALADLASRAERVLVRTAEGARLHVDPWSAQ